MSPSSRLRSCGARPSPGLGVRGEACHQGLGRRVSEVMVGFSVLHGSATRFGAWTLPEKILLVASCTRLDKTQTKDWAVSDVPLSRRIPQVDHSSQLKGEGMKNTKGCVPGHRRGVLELWKKTCSSTACPALGRSFGCQD